MVKSIQLEILTEEDVKNFLKKPVLMIKNGSAEVSIKNNTTTTTYKYYPAVAADTAQNKKGYAAGWYATVPDATNGATPDATSYARTCKERAENSQVGNQ